MNVKKTGRKLIDYIMGVNGKYKLIKFTSGNKLLKCFVPDDQLWISIKELLILSEYEKLKEFELENLNENLLVDAGAHAGLFTLKASPHFKRIISIEPHPLLFKILKKNIKINKLNNIEILQRALWHENCNELILMEFPFNTANNSVKLTGNFRGVLYKVKPVTLKEIIQKYNSIDLLKMDIEGAEFEVIENMDHEILKKIRKIVLEVHLSSDYNEIDKITEKLSKAGFKIKIFERPQFYPLTSFKMIMKNWKVLKGLTELKILTFLVFIFFIILKNIKILDPKNFQNTKTLYAYK